MSTLHWFYYVTCAVNIVLCAEIALWRTRVDCCVWRWWI